MSLITRCPACQTTFRVVPDQLRISEGWVRCGQCQQIFDANAALLGGPAEAQVLPAATPNSVGQSAPNLADTLTEANTSAGAPDLSLAFGAADEASGAKPDATPIVDDLPEAQLPPWQVPKALAALPALPTQTTQVQEVQAARQDLSFMRSMPAPVSWQRTVLRAFLGFIALGLAAVLGLQAAVHERERIAAMFPQLKPALLWICQQAKCSLSGLRQIESVVIDSSSFNKVRGDAYRLSLVLRNVSPLEVAMPALELTLTDSQDQAVMRRVLLANEYSTNSVIGAAADWSGAVSFAVRANGAVERFSGYRVLAFYP